jgi:anti-anti-sigma factor
MAHTHREEDGVVIFELEGKIMGTPHDNYLILDKVYEFTTQNKFKMVMDFSNVEWMNSRGIGICVTTVTAMRNRGGDMVMACLNDKVESLLKKMHMFKIFKAYPTVSEAVSSLK